MPRTHLNHRWIWLLWAAAATAGMLSCRTADDLELRLLDHAGEPRSYYLHVPVLLDSSVPAPLVIALHRLTETGEKMARETGFNAYADAEQFIVAYPNGKYRAFSFDKDDEPDDSAFVLAVIEDVAAEHAIDRSRIYLVGASNGEFLVYTLVCEHPEIFAAAAPAMATFLEKYTHACQPGLDTPLIIIHGDADFVVPYYTDVLFAGRKFDVLPVPETVRFWAEINGCRPEPIIEPIPNTVPGDGTTSVKETYYDDNGVPRVVHIRVRNGGHTWPGGYEPLPPFMTGKQSKDFSATAMIWDFFSLHRLKTPGPAHREPRP